MFADKEEDAFCEGYFYHLLPRYSDRVADRIVKLVEVWIDIATAIVSGTIFIVLIWAGIFWLSGTTGILIQLIAVALGGSSIVFIVKDKRSRIRKWENIPVWVRGVLVPEQKYAGLVRTFTKEMQKRLHSLFGLKFRTKRHVDKVIKGLRDAINRILVDIG